MPIDSKYLKCILALLNYLKYMFGKSNRFTSDFLFWRLNIELPTQNEIRLIKYIFSFPYDSFGILHDKWDTFFLKKHKLIVFPSHDLRQRNSPNLLCKQMR